MKCWWSNRTTPARMALCLAAAVLLLAAASRKKTTVPTVSPAQLAEQIRALLERKGANTIRWGVCVARADTGEVLYAYHPDDLFIPASNRKLFVTALALDRLGADFRFTTPLYLSAPIRDDGSVAGDLIVRGTGDPTFLNPRFHRGSMTATLQEWADGLAALGVRAIQGNLIMDESGFVSGGLPADGWIKDYETAEYAPRASAVGIAGNRISVSVRPAAQSGRPAVVSLLPATSVVTVENRTLTGPRGTADTIAVERGTNGPDHLILRGRLALGAPEQVHRVPLEQAALVAGEVFRACLAKKGIILGGVVSVRNGESATTAPSSLLVGRYQSPPLREIIAVTNKQSDNYCAEQLFQATAFVRRQRTSYKEAQAYEEEFLAEIGILPSAANFEDGSGLSRLNLVSPRAVVTLLNYMARHKEGQVFRDSLAVAGRDGTLSGRMGQRALGKIHAKTGSLSVACCLSGYAQTASGHTVAFSILANNCANRTGEVCAIQDRIGQLLVGLRF
ncbi:MAG: D-alanyl-D-alanine carboxypeptidase/D-alanyl-D-alanine-endopeptidase [Candidatus Sumerlaeia bacterium]|nr:D-alanyl-D-alanine carboxypeptidase/D-alanyl-D-alanine-endopeptidase [Candidatus Sumerlaeia bacterium]